MLFDSLLYEKHTHDQRIKAKKEMTYPEIIKEFGSKETRIKEARVLLR